MNVTLDSNLPEVPESNPNGYGSGTSAYADLRELAQTVNSAINALTQPDPDVERIAEQLSTALLRSGLAESDYTSDPSQLGYYKFVGDETLTYLPHFSAVQEYLLSPQRRGADAGLLEVIATFHESVGDPLPEGTTDEELLEALDIRALDAPFNKRLVEKARRLGRLGVPSDILDDVDEEHIVHTFTV